MEGVVATKQDYDELEMLLGEIPNVTSANPQAEANAKLRICEEQMKRKSSASGPYANLCHSPPFVKQGGDAAYRILNFADKPFDQELQSSGKIDGDEGDYRPASLEELYLPDDRSLTSALENLSIDDSIARGPTMSSSVSCGKASHIHGVQFGNQFRSPVEKCFAQLAPVQMSVSQTTHPVDGLNMSTPTFQECPPLKTSVIDKFSFQLSNNVDKPPKFNVDELMRQKSESLSGVPLDQQHNPGSMYSGGMSFMPGRNTLQFLSGVSFSGADFPSSGFQQPCYLEAQHPMYMPSQHFSHPHIAWQKFEEDRHCRMHQQCFYVQQFHNQEMNPFQNGDRVSLGSLTGSPIQSNFDLPIHQIEQADQGHYWSRNVLHRGVNPLGFTLMGSGSCQYYAEGFCGKEENCARGHVRKQTTTSNARYSSKYFKGAHALNKLGKQIFPKKILTRPQAPDSLRTLRSNSPTSNQSPIHPGFEGRALPSGQLQPPFQISTSLQVDGQDCEGSSDNSSDRLTSRPPKPKYRSLNEVIGKIYATAKEPQGCRFLQEKFEEGTPEDVHKVFIEVIDHIVELMTDPYGNYLIQKLLEVCNDEQKMYIIHAITSKDGELIRISCDTHGTRAIQKVVESLRTPEQISMVVSSLKPGILSLIKDNNGNHVAQRCLQCLPPEFSKFLFDAVIAHCVELARDRRGCCVLQKCLSHCSGQQRERLISEISCNALVLSQDQFGYTQDAFLVLQNYVVQYLLELKVVSEMEGVLDQLEGNFGCLSVQKYSSNVVEKCLECAIEGWRSRIIWELINNPLLLQILQDPYGNYVIQSAIRLCKGALHAAFMKVIRPHIPVLRSNPYGRKVLSSFSTRK